MEVPAAIRNLPDMDRDVLFVLWQHTTDKQPELTSYEIYVRVCERLEEQTPRLLKRFWRIYQYVTGALSDVHMSIVRLIQRNFISTRKGEPTPARRGIPELLCSLTEQAIEIMRPLEEAGMPRGGRITDQPTTIPSLLTELQKEILSVLDEHRRAGEGKLYTYEISKAVGMRKVQQPRETPPNRKYWNKVFRAMPGHGTLLNALSALEEAGLLESEWEDLFVAAAEKRPKRSFYSLTPEGIKIINH